MASTEGRQLCDQLRPGWLSSFLKRGAGMGGPLSPLAWNVSFDPVIWIAEILAVCRILAYVDDLLAKVSGPGQLTLAYLVLLAATHQA